MEYSGLISQTSDHEVSLSDAWNITCNATVTYRNVNDKLCYTVLEHFQNIFLVNVLCTLQAFAKQALSCNLETLAHLCT